MKDFFKRFFSRFFKKSHVTLSTLKAPFIKKDSEGVMFFEPVDIGKSFDDAESIDDFIRKINKK